MGSLLAVGGIQIPEDILKNIDRDIHSICSDAGFPPMNLLSGRPVENYGCGVT